MNDLQPYIQAIQEAYPAYVVEEAVFNEDGQYNHVLIVNETHIFRFPRYQGGLEQLALETKILAAVQGFLPLPVPNPLFVQFDPPQIGQSFMGYRIIPGEPLWPDAFARITSKHRLAVQIGGFLKALHAVPIRQLIDQPLPVSETREEWQEIYGRIQIKLFPFMRLDACKAVARHFENALDDPAFFQFERVLRHGDFGTGNLLHDPAAQQMSGVIDFGFTVLGDPAFDVAGLLTYGRPFVDQVVAHYPAIEKYWPRIMFYRGTFALFDALFGIENGDRAAFESGMAAYV